MKKVPSSDIQFLQSLIFMTVSYAWLAYFMTLMNVFHGWLVWSMWLVFHGYLFWKKHLTLPRPSRFFLTVQLITIFVALLIAITTEPSIYAGRDQGSISDAAMQLVVHHGPQFHTPESDMMFAHYGAGKALNFPGFFYTATGALTTQFPLPYITFLAGFISLIGVSGVIVANLILFILFVLALSTIARLFLTTRYIWWFLALLLTAAPVLFFSTLTLSENLAGALLFASIMLFLMYRHTRDPHTLLILIATMTLLLFTRIEGIALFLVTAFLLVRDQVTRQWMCTRGVTIMSLYLAFLFSVTLAALVVNFSFYQTLLGVFVRKVAPIAPAVTDTHDTFSFLLETYISFNVLIPLIFTALYVFAVMKFTKQKKYTLIPLVITTPLFIYYITPHITLDAPWMLRRFVFATLPLSLLYTVLFVSFIAHHKKGAFWAPLLFAVLVFYNLTTTLPLFAYTDHRTLAQDTARLATHFTHTDLILLSPHVTGDGFAMIDAPLRTQHDLHAVYFFNQEDFHNMETSAFARVFLVVAEEDQMLYTDLITQNMICTPFAITTTFLPPQKTLQLSLTRQEKTTRSKIYQLR